MINNILLLYMPTPRQTMLPFPPLGISVLAGYLRRKRINVHIDDLEMKYWEKDIIDTGPLKQLARRLPLKYNNPKIIFFNKKIIRNYLENNINNNKLIKIFNEWDACLNVNVDEYKYVGFSIMEKNHLTASMCFAKYLQEKYKVEIILGGSFITKPMNLLLQRYPFINYLIVGEGEIPLFRLLSGEKKELIKNLIFRGEKQSVTNKIISQYAESMEPDFEGLPFDLYRRYKTLLIPYEMSKGCRNRCSFCTTRRKKLYFKDIGTIIDEISRIKEKYKTTYFLFFDNAINIDKSFSIDLCRQFIRSRLNIAWSAYYIPESSDKSYFKLLSDAGCIQLRWGVETLAKEALKEMGKYIDKDEISQALKNSHSAGVWNHLIFMIGHPGERMIDMLGFISFISKNKRYFKSAVISPFVMERVSLVGDAEKSYRDRYINGRVYDREMFGIKYVTFEDRHLRLKRKILETALKYNGIKFIGNFSRTKDDIEKDQFNYNSFLSFQ